MRHWLSGGGGWGNTRWKDNGGGGGDVENDPPGKGDGAALPNGDAAAGAAPKVPNPVGAAAAGAAAKPPKPTLGAAQAQMYARIDTLLYNMTADRLYLQEGRGGGSTGIPHTCCGPKRRRA